MARFGVAIIGTFILVLILLNYLSSNSNQSQFAKMYASSDYDLPYSEVKQKLVRSELVTSASNVTLDKEKCDIIHVALICAGDKANLNFYTVLKSLLFFRHNPLHFHVAVNSISEKVLTVLFATWNLPQVNVTFYNLTDTLSDVRWVPNAHYAGVYALLKLTFTKLVPLSVTKKIIVIDTDIIFNDDIYELWEMFKNFNESQAIGLVENQSNFYLDRKGMWPVLGRGYNTGIMLYNLERMADIHWDRLWSNVARRTIMVYGQTRLADQDIINAVIRENPKILFEVPCQWNTQLSVNTLSHHCYKKNKIKVIHWNSPKKFDVENVDGEYFRNKRTMFLQFNGNLLRSHLFHCGNTPSKNTTDTSNAYICNSFDKAQKGKWTTLLFFREFTYNPSSEYDVTYVVQLSFDRFQMFEDLCKNWQGPISVTFYLTDPEFQEVQRFIKDSALLESRSDIAYHVVFKDGELYPINYLRNVGLRNVNTNYVFLADTDFLPMRNSYYIIQEHIKANANMDKKALVVPAFETQRYKSRLPKNKAQLLNMLREKKIYTFRYDVWAPGQAPTNYTRWTTAKTPYTVDWEPDYEPYIVVKRAVPEYDVRFMGFGWNKVAHIMELAAQCYTFIVLPDVFIVHKPHAPSYDINKFRSSPEYRMCLQILKEKFIEDIGKKYNSDVVKKISKAAVIPS